MKRNHAPAHYLEEFPGAGLDPEAVDFGRAVHEYKRLNQRPYPTWPEVLAVARSRGWRRVIGRGASPRGRRGPA